MLKQEIMRGYSYLKNKGIESTIIKAKRHIKEQASYHRRPALDVSILEKQRSRQFGYSPLISIIVPLYKTPENFLRAMIDSVREQTYTNWELCLADGTAVESNISEIVRQYKKEDSRIKYRLLESNEGISGNTNAGLKMATGEFIGLADHDDILAPDALYEIVRALNKNAYIDTIYTDEDKTDMSGKVFSMPHFKPDYNPDYFMANNYICHFFVTKRKIALATGGFDSRYDGAQDYDFICRCIENSDVVHHIPKVLYHWRCHNDSTAGRPESKLYAYENGIKVIEDHYKRCGIKADVSMYPDAYGYYRTRYQCEDTKITVIYTGTDKNEERDIKYPHDEYYVDEFSQAKISSIIEQQANRYVLLLDNSMYITDEGVRNLVANVMREDVAIAGGRIYDKRRKLVYGGLVLGAKGFFGYSFEGTSIKDRGYYLRICVPQNTMGVDVRCMMIDTEYYDKVAGLTDEFPASMSGVDYCMKVIFTTGKLVTYAADTVVYSSKVIRPVIYDKDDIERFKDVWGKRIKKGDPFYNYNLTLNKTDYSLVSAKKIRRNR